MANSFELSVVAPDRTVVDEQTTSLVAPAQEGYMGVMAGHAPAIVALRPGLLEFLDKNNQREYIAIDGGFMEVGPTQTIVLADDAVHAYEIDIKKAEERLEMARKALRGEESDMTSEDATLEVERALVRIKLARMNGNSLPAGKS